MRSLLPRYVALGLRFMYSSALRKSAQFLRHERVEVGTAGYSEAFLGKRPIHERKPR